VVGQGKLSVGAPYFNAVFVPLMTPTLFLIGVGPMARWRRATLPDLAVRLRWAFVTSVVVSIMVPIAAGTWKPLVSLGLLLALWIVLTTGIGVHETIAAAGGWRRMLSASRRSYYGMQLAHLGVAVSIAGVTVVTGYQTEKDQRMNVGDTVSVAGYEFRFNGMSDVAGPNYRAEQAAIEVSKDNRTLRTLRPEKRLYYASGNATTETAIDSGVLRDLYVSLGEPLEGDSWRIRIQYKPLIDWIWAGAILMAIGGGLAMSDRRYVHAHVGLGANAKNKKGYRPPVAQTAWMTRR
jgi:cytochrome c-type biogenesis protein CcmF